MASRSRRSHSPLELSPPVEGVRGPCPPRMLTAREREVLALLGQHYTDAEIGALLSISRRTASNHVSNILGKVGAANRREAGRMVMRGAQGR